jgi:hypothetical protein
MKDSDPSGRPQRDPSGDPSAADPNGDLNR